MKITNINIIFTIVNFYANTNEIQLDFYALINLDYMAQNFKELANTIWGVPDLLRGLVIQKVLSN